MITAARALRRHLPVLVAILLALGATGSPAWAGTAGATTTAFQVHLEAGPQAGLAFDAAGRETSRRTITVSRPVNVAGSMRSALPVGGTWLRIASGALAGRWVRESAVAYIRGFVGSTTFAPARTVVLPAARWELYRFDVDGVMTAAHGWTTEAPTAVRIDRTAVIRGMRFSQIAGCTFGGWWLPGTASSPQRITCTAGRPPEGSQPVVVRSVPAATGEVALTFDMGGRLVPALSIVRYLELTRTCATIFPTGVAAQTQTGLAVMAEIRAHPELFELGNHTVNHCDLRDGGGGAACPATRPDDAFVTTELAGADAIVAPLAGTHTTPYWRPPYGASDAALRSVAARAGYPYTILWSVDTIDWRPVADGGPTASQSAAKVIAGRVAGGVVLMHLGGYTTRDALPAMVKGLRDAGWTPTSVSALFRAGH